jgi:predicted RNA-binding protein YlxR (DUF448 family)
VARGGKVKERDSPERRCVVTRESQPKAGLIRFVIGPEGEVVPDLAAKLPGRGLYVSADAEALRKAAAKGHFARAAKRAVKAPPDLAEQVDAQLARRVVDLLAMARKAGAAVAGLEKTKAALVSGKAALLVQASDGSARGRAALRPPSGADSLVSCLSGNEMGLAFARDNVIHAAVLAGGLAERIRDEARRLAGLRGKDGGATSPDAAGDDAAAGEGPRTERQTTE